MLGQFPMVKTVRLFVNFAIDFYFRGKSTSDPVWYYYYYSSEISEILDFCYASTSTELLYCRLIQLTLLSHLLFVNFTFILILWIIVPSISNYVASWYYTYYRIPDISCKSCRSLRLDTKLIIGPEILYIQFWVAVLPFKKG